MSKFAESLNRSSLGSQLYRLQTRPQLLAQSQQVERLYELLTDFGFIAAKALHPEIKLQELIEDYDRAFEPSVLIAGEKAETLKLIQAALLQSAHILNKDKTQLVEQLWGRLHSFDIPEIQAMLSQAKQSKTCWLRLLTSSLTRADGRLLRTLIGHNDSVNAVAVTSDGKQIISGSSDNTLKVWNLKTGEEIFTLEGHTQAVTAVVVTPDGKGVISASNDNTIKIWDLQTAMEIFTLKGHQGSVNAIVVTSDGKRLFSGSSDKTIKEWNLETGEEISTINDRSIEGVTITHDDRWVIFCASYPIRGEYVSIPNWKIIIYDLKTKKKKTLSSTGGNSVNTFAITQDDKWVVFGSYGATLEIFNLENFKRKYFKTSGKLTNKKDFFTLNEHNNWVKAVTLTPDSKRIVSASADKTLKVWDREKSKELFTLEGHAGSVNSVAVTPNGKWAISASKDKTLKVWSIASEEEEKFTFISDIQLLDNEKISKNDCNLENILKWENSKKILPFINQTDSVDAIEVTPDGRRVVSASLGKTITVFNLETHEVISIHNQEDKEENFAFHTIAITPDSKYLISDTGKAMLSLWNLETGKFLFYLPSIFSVVSCYAFKL
ncbi:WD-40 repeat protein [Fischerella sp. NIES-4106]|nr:WD-40 repeat protein [Fischerella sp. NIES-4106]